MYTFAGEFALDPDALRARLARMDDAALAKFGRAAARGASTSTQHLPQPELERVLIRTLAGRRPAGRADSSETHVCEPLTATGEAEPYAWLIRCLSFTFFACSRGDSPFEFNQASSFPTVSSCAVVGASTTTFKRVPGPTPDRTNPELNSASASAAASYSDSAQTATEYAIPAPSSNETRRNELGTTTA